MEKKGVSPVVATVLLILIVIIIALIIFLWARGFVSERVVKDGRAVELSCEGINFEAGLFDGASGYELEVVNRGNVPLYGFNLLVSGTGEVLSQERLDSTLGLGRSREIPNLPSISPGDSITVVPIILGESGSGKVAHTCDENYGQTVTA